MTLLVLSAGVVAITHLSAQSGGAASAAGAGRLDFGDAPDGGPAGYLTKPSVAGNFDSRRASLGPSHPRRGRGLVLGFRSSAERDSRQVDRDSHDEGTSLPRLRACSPRSKLLAVVNARGLPRRAFNRRSRRKLYVNAWFDYNRDGDFEDGTDGCAPEWGVQNLAIPARALRRGRAGVVPIRFRAGRQVGELWWRVTLTLDQKVTDPAGRAQRPYRFGETEDHLLRSPGLPAAASASRPPAARLGRTGPPASSAGAAEDLLKQGRHELSVTAFGRPPPPLDHGRSYLFFAEVPAWDEFTARNEASIQFRVFERRIHSPRPLITDSFRVGLRPPPRRSSFARAGHSTGPYVRVTSLLRHPRRNPIEPVDLEVEYRGRLTVFIGFTKESEGDIELRVNTTLLIVHRRPIFPRPRRAPQPHTTGVGGDGIQEKATNYSFTCPASGTVRQFVDIFIPATALTLRHPLLLGSTVLHDESGAGPHSMVGLGSQPCSSGTTTTLHDGEGANAPTLGGMLPPPDPPAGKKAFRFAFETTRASGTGPPTVNLTAKVRFDETP